MKKSLLRNNPTSDEINDSDRDLVNEGSLQHIIKKNRKVEQQKSSPYINANFILGSTSELERLWSIAGDILSLNRKSMTTLLFEALLFLRVNNLHWGYAVVEAMSKVRSEKVKDKIDGDKDQHMFSADMQ